MKYLIMGTCWLPGEMAVWLCKQWYAAARHLDPEADLLIVDCLSPHEVPVLGQPKLTFIQQDVNVGHLEKTNRDGYGRALTIGLNWVCEQDYDWVAVWDCDFMMVRSAGKIMEDLDSRGKRVASCWCHMHHWLEAMEFFRVDWLRETEFTKRYDWENVQKPRIMAPERHMQALMEPELEILPLVGIRDDPQSISKWNIWSKYPKGLDYITHNKDKDVYRLVQQRYGLPIVED